MKKITVILLMLGILVCPLAAEGSVRESLLREFILLEDLRPYNDNEGTMGSIPLGVKFEAYYALRFRLCGDLPTAEEIKMVVEFMTAQRVFNDDWTIKDNIDISLKAYDGANEVVKHVREVKKQKVEELRMRRDRNVPCGKVKSERREQEPARSDEAVVRELEVISLKTWLAEREKQFNVSVKMGRDVHIFISKAINFLEQYKRDNPLPEGCDSGKLANMDTAELMQLMEYPHNMEGHVSGRAGRVEALVDVSRQADDWLLIFREITAMRNYSVIDKNDIPFVKKLKTQHAVFYKLLLKYREDCTDPCLSVNDLSEISTPEFKKRMERYDDQQKHLRQIRNNI
ncbi:MAG: hypothetical protein LBL71_01550, partial [Endomicrobium sp.]|nr:hypothetical protein [Endomicrobium sp.]